jgi:hypothetical protein
MGIRARIEERLRRHRVSLAVVWAAVCVAVLAVLAVGPAAYMIRGIAPLPRVWAMMFFLSLWIWVGLRFIALWIWAWTVMVLAPVCLFIPLRDHLDAPWLGPLIGVAVALSAMNVAVAGWWQWRRRSRA